MPDKRDYDALMTEFERTIDYIVGADLPDLPLDDRHRLVTHLTGALIVTTMRADDA